MHINLSPKDIVAGAIAYPRRMCGIYFLVDDGEIVYVGQAVDLRRRLVEHYELGAKPFDSYFFLPTNESDLDAVEAHYIHALKPKYNHAKSWGRQPIKYLLSQVPPV
jgi:excinuclease UvrABC nuclease subunit